MLLFVAHGLLSPKPKNLQDNILVQIECPCRISHKRGLLHRLISPFEPRLHVS